MVGKVLSSHSAIQDAAVGTRCYDAEWRTVRRVRGGWRYEASADAGLFTDYEIHQYGPLSIIEQTQPEPAPPIPRVPSRVIGRAYWTPDNPSPWVSFPGISSYRFWGADVRRFLPRLRTEMVYLDHVHTAASLLSVAEAKGSRPERPEIPEGGGIGIWSAL